MVSTQDYQALLDTAHTFKSVTQTIGAQFMAAVGLEITITQVRTYIADYA